VTETPQVQEALDELRAQLGNDRVPMGEIVILGARAKVAELKEGADQQTMLRKRAADRIRERRALPIDIEAVDEARRSGWVRPL
jgi:hypothetical protein